MTRESEQQVEEAAPAAAEGDDFDAGWDAAAPEKADDDAGAEAKEAPTAEAKEEPIAEAKEEEPEQQDSDGSETEVEDPPAGKDAAETLSLESLAEQLAKYDRDTKANMGRLHAELRRLNSGQPGAGARDGGGERDAPAAGSPPPARAASTFNVEEKFKDQIGKLREYDPEVADTVTGMMRGLAEHFERQVGDARQTAERVTQDQRVSAEIAILNEVMPQDEWSSILARGDDQNFVDENFATFVEELPLKEARKLYSDDVKDVADVLRLYAKKDDAPSDGSDAAVDGDKSTGNNEALAARKRARQRGGSEVRTRGSVPPTRVGDGDDFDAGWEAAGRALARRHATA